MLPSHWSTSSIDPSRQKRAAGPVPQKKVVSSSLPSIESAEQDGLEYAFKVRCISILVVCCAILALSPWPRSGYYLGFAGTFFLLGWLPYRLRRHRKAEAIKLLFVVFDVVLITGAVLNLPSSGSSVDWPIQMRLRNQNFLLLILLLGEAALTYSPRRVLWTGGAIATLWSTAVLALYLQPTSRTYSDMIEREGSDLDLLRVFLEPTYVSLPQWLAQLVAVAILTVLLAAAVGRSRHHLLAQVQAEVLRSDLARYVSPDVADAIAGGAAPCFGTPATRRAAVLFADVVGFTALSERLSPDRTFALLRSLQTRCSRVVFRRAGTLDKFLGDGFMATFGSLHDEPDAAARAVACAFELQGEIERWNAKRGQRGAEPLFLAIGVHYGPVVFGNIGGNERVEFTAVGDVVNVASRLERITREHRCAIAVSDACRRAAEAGGSPVPGFQRQAEVAVKGREGRLLVHFGGCR